MLNEASIRKDLEKTARDIVSRKFWCILDAALFLGFSRTYTDMFVDKMNCYVVRIGGKKHVYAIDVLKLFEKQTGMSFPELAAKWYKDFKIAPQKIRPADKNHRTILLILILFCMLMPV